MTDEQIAGALVEAGILYRCIDGDGKRSYSLPGKSWRPAAEAISDWRTAGACLERMTIKQCEDAFLFREGPDSHFTIAFMRRPRDICEAFARAQSPQDSG